MSESIQVCPAPDRTCARRAFLCDAAELYGRPPAVSLDDLDDVDDSAALLLAFPWLSDAELLEALWALGHF